MATASPAKFEEAVLEAGLHPQPTPSIQSLSELPTKFSSMEAGEDWLAVLRAKIEEIDRDRGDRL